jgi:hypothetical protein
MMSRGMNGHNQGVSMCSIKFDQFQCLPQAPGLHLKPATQRSDQNGGTLLASIG